MILSPTASVTETILCMLPSLMLYITCMPSRCFSVLYGYEGGTKKKKKLWWCIYCGASLALSQAASATKSTLSSKMWFLWPPLSWWPTLLFYFFSIDPLHLHCPRYNSLCVSAMIKGSSLQPLLKKQGLPTACKSNPSIDSTSCGHQAPVGSRREAGNEPIRLVLGQRAVSQAGCGWFVKTELDFKPSWDKYYGVVFFFFQQDPD